ncbi:MAG: hypothetical protein U0325_26460 [Polyangiales bacterium]
MDASLTAGGRVAGRYELVAPIVDAGITEAWTARDPQAGEVRVSVLGPLTPAVQSQLAPTWERLRVLSNPGILAPTEVGGADGVCFTVSGPLDGRPLANWLEGHRQADTRPGFGVVQRLFDRLASALLSAHNAGVVHGALSPRCVLLKRVGQGQHHLRVCDLALGPFTAGSATTPSWFDYLAPEQRTPRAEDGVAVDVFACAAILVEMLTLSPGPRADARETWGQFVREAKGAAVVERLVALRKDVPRPVWDVVASGLALTARERGTLQRFQRALRETWTAVGEWDRSALAEPDPPAPDPSRLRARTSLPTAAPRARSGEVIEGWQRAERAATVMPTPAPVRAEPPRPEPSPEPPRSRTALAGTPAIAVAPVFQPAPAPAYVPAAAPVAAPARTVESPMFDAGESGEATEAIDLAAAEMYLQSLHRPSLAEAPAAPHPTAEEVREHTQAIDAAAFFEGSLAQVDALHEAGGTAVLSQQGGVAAAVAAAAAGGARDESTRMLDVPDAVAPGFAAWTAGPGTASDPYGRSGSGFGVDDPFAASAERPSVPAFGGAPPTWTASTAPPTGSSPFAATLKAVPRESMPSPVRAQPAPAQAPSPEKLWGAAPAPLARSTAPAPEPKVPVWQWAVLVAAILGVGAAMYLALTAR